MTYDERHAMREGIYQHLNILLSKVQKMFADTGDLTVQQMIKCPSLETLTFLSIFTLWLLEPKSSSLKERLSSFRDLLITQPREGKGRRKTHENVHLKLIAAHTVTN